jgi:hypothetical protein
MPDGLKRYYGRGDLHFVFYDFNVYAREPGDPETSEASERLAVEQLVGLHER